MSLECRADSCDLIRDFQKKFSCGLNFKCFKWEDFYEHLSNLEYDNCENHCDVLLNLTVDSDLIKEYSSRKSYLQFFLKHLLKQAENYNIAHTRTYETYVKLLNCTSKDPEEYYKHFLFRNKCVSLKENKNFIYGGTTGLCTWEGGVALGNWCLHRADLLTNSHILELGSGSGLTGLALLSHLPSIRSYTFTDYHPLVLDQLSFNIGHNLHQGVDFPLVYNNQTFVNVLPLNWELDGPEKWAKVRPKPNVIIAADVIYDDRLISAFVQTLAYFIDSSDKLGVVACTVRNQATLDSFIDYIKAKQLEIEIDSSEFPFELEQNPFSQVNIYIVKKAT